MRYGRDILERSLALNKEYVRLPDHEFNQENDLPIITRLEGLVETAMHFLERCAQAIENDARPNA